ncbi:unnamed protein product [Hymenolepis diminuta]|uniref:Uncharacterized protein n=1 Tax=Hymenolepis diminuta TaxID=6216 RepID=A0A564YSM4_HYMDI|nr:unnamed protein product [Hymenolepis diminuta]
MSRPGTQRTFYKDLQQLHKTIETSTDGQAEIIGIDEMTVRVALKPKTGYNAHAVFTMTDDVPMNIVDIDLADVRIRYRFNPIIDNTDVIF